jgi:5-methylcytosine-specific restriction endonuclease McrA
MLECRRFGWTRFPGSSVGRAAGCRTWVTRGGAPHIRRSSQLSHRCRQQMTEDGSLQSLTYKGGRCQRCSYDRCTEALEFHHLTSTKKDFGISSKGCTRSWEKIQAELDKCVLLCTNCHREVHSSLQPPRETVVETSGEFREAFLDSTENRNGNPERSLPKGQRVGRNVQRLEAAEPIQ